MWCRATGSSRTTAAAARAAPGCSSRRGPAITENLFSGHVAAAVNTAGDASRPSTGLLIERNRSVDDATFAVVVNAAGASVAQNVITRTVAATAPASSGILVGGGTSGVQVVRNVISGGAANGIRVSNAFGTPNSGLVVSANTVSRRLNGMRFSAQISGTVSGNVIGDSTEVGIALDADNAGVTLSRNVIGRSGVLDCRDASLGAGTAGTANTWTSNVARSSLPRRICGF